LISEINRLAGVALRIGEAAETCCL
jgi:hypothetical protein